MIDATLAQLALRNRAIALSVCTTGSTSLSATTTGYARAAGSFVTDGFQVGMELLAAGFSEATNNGYSVIEAVTAGALRISGGRTVEVAGSGKTLTVGLPQGRAWENVKFTPVAGRPYIEEDFVPQPSRLRTFPASGGIVEEPGLYILKWYGLSRTDVVAIRKCVDALKARFAPGTGITLSDGNVVRVRTDIGPFAGQIVPIAGGWSVLTLTVPWLARSTNTIAV